MKCGNAALSLLVVCFAGVSGCKIQVNENDHGDAKKVKISTPLGGLNVQTNQTDAEDLGLPVYPGAQVSKDENNSGSANVNLGFGAWQLRVKVVNYESPDPQEKVIAFYRKALNAYGDVIECRGDAPVSTPAMTREGLSCSDSNHAHQGTHVSSADLQLKAGSIHHQHVVAFKSKGAPGTGFVLISLDLPHALESKDQQTN